MAMIVIYNQYHRGGTRVHRLNFSQRSAHRNAARIGREAYICQVFLISHLVVAT